MTDSDSDKTRQDSARTDESNMFRLGVKDYLYMQQIDSAGYFPGGWFRCVGIVDASQSSQTASDLDCFDVDGEMPLDAGIRRTTDQRT